MVKGASPGAAGRKIRKLRDEVSSRNIASEEVKSLLRDLMLVGSKDEPGDVGRLASSILVAIEEDEKAKRPVRKPLQYMLWSDDPEGVAIALAVDDRFYDYATW